MFTVIIYAPSPVIFWGEWCYYTTFPYLCPLDDTFPSILKGSTKACHLHKQPGDEHRCPGVPTARRLRGHGQLTTYAHSTHKVSKSQVTARIPSLEKQLSHPALHMKPNAQWEDFFTPPPPNSTPPPPPRNSTLQPSVVKWCCPHQRRAMCKKTKNTHDCINNKCQYLTEMEASFSRWLLIILLTQSCRRPAGVGFGLVYSGSRTQKPKNITSRNKFGKCIPFHGS